MFVSEDQMDVRRRYVDDSVLGRRAILCRDDPECANAIENRRKQGWSLRRRMNHQKDGRRQLRWKVLQQISDGVEAASRCADDDNVARRHKRCIAIIDPLAPSTPTIFL